MRANRVTVALDIGFLPGLEVELIGARHRLAVEQRVDRDTLGGRLWRLDPEFPEIGELLVGLLPGPDRKSARGKPVTLAAAQETEVTRAEEGNHLVPDVGRVDRIAQAEPGEPEVDRKTAADLVVPVVPEVRRIGDRSRKTVAQHVDDHRPLVEVPEVEEFEPEIAATFAKQRLVRLEADVPPGVEVEIGEPVRHRRKGRVIGGRRQFLRALDHIVVAEGGLCARRGRRPARSAQLRARRAPRRKQRRC